MKILHIFLNMGAAPNYPIRNAMKSVFSGYGEIDWLDLERRFGVKYLNEVIRKEVQFNHYDICFMQIQREGVIEPKTVTLMRNLGVFVVNWTGDVSINTKWIEELGRYCNLNLFTNRTDSDRLTGMGVKSDYLQVSFDDKNFVPDGSKGNYGEIVFCGNNYEGTAAEQDYQLIHERKNMVLSLKKEFGDIFQVYGVGWGRYFGKDTSLNVIQEAECYRSAKIAINYSHFDYKNYSSDRIFRIMGSGCFCLSHEYQSIRDDFNVGEHLDVFTDNILIDKVKYWLQEEKERKYIAKNGCKLVHGYDTWTDRFNELIKLYENYK